MLILDDLIATENPPAEKNIQVLALNVATEGRKAANVRDEKPARDTLDLAQRPLHHVRFVLLLKSASGCRNLKTLIADCDLIPVTESNGMMDSSLV